MQGFFDHVLIPEGLFVRSLQRHPNARSVHFVAGDASGLVVVPSAWDFDFHAMVTFACWPLHLGNHLLRIHP